MDLSFSRFEFDTPLVVLPPDLAVMMVGVAARQAASPTALFQSQLLRTPLAADPFAPPDGAFDGRVASMLRETRGVKDMFTEPL